MTFAFISHMQNGLGSSTAVFYVLLGVLRNSSEKLSGDGPSQGSAFLSPSQPALESSSSFQSRSVVKRLAESWQLQLCKPNLREELKQAGSSQFNEKNIFPPISLLEKVALSHQYSLK